MRLHVNIAAEQNVATLLHEPISFPSLAASDFNKMNEPYIRIDRQWLTFGQSVASILCDPQYATTLFLLLRATDAHQPREGAKPGAKGGSCFWRRRI